MPSMYKVCWNRQPLKKITTHSTEALRQCRTPNVDAMGALHSGDSARAESVDKADDANAFSPLPITRDRNWRQVSSCQGIKWLI